MEPRPRRLLMPVYEFICKKCNGGFSETLKVSEYEKRKFRCPKCRSTKVEQQISSFQTITSKKS
jgi:putative FmdB family regulatory protein